MIVLAGVPVAVLSAHAELFRLQSSHGKVPRYDWNHIPESKLPEEVEKAVEKLIPHVKGKRCLLTPFQANETKPAGWGVERQIEFLVRSRISAAGASCVDTAPFLKLIHPDGPGAGKKPVVQYGSAVVKKAAELTGADVVVTGSCAVGGGARATLTVYDGTKGTRLESALMTLSAVDITLAANTPLTNRKIIAWAEHKIGKKIDRGECVDLAIFGLQEAGSKPPALSQYLWGERLPPGVMPLPGDIIQFENATFGESSIAHHTVVVYDVFKPGEIEVLHQNWANGNESGRVVAFKFFSGIDRPIRGEVLIYRPLPPETKK
jgi:hypothetical protein